MYRMPNFPEFPYESNQFKTIVADPPWKYDDNCSGNGRGADEHYDTLTIEQIQSLGNIVNTIAAGHSHLYLWTTNKFLVNGDAARVVKSWGFTPKTIITWIKSQSAPNSLPYQRDDPTKIKERIGMGNYLRNCTEQIIFATKGNLNTLRNDVPNFFTADRSEHSKKPEKTYQLVEDLSKEPYLEMFARNKRDNWEVWGKEV